jgi:hypothetical protein
MGKLEELVCALYTNYNSAMSSGIQFRYVFKFLLDEDIAKWLSVSQRETLALQFAETEDVSTHK